MVDLNALEEAARKATPGPWYSQTNDLIGGKMVALIDAPASSIGIGGRTVADMINRDEDSDYIAAIPPDVSLAMIMAIRSSINGLDVVRQHVRWVEVTKAWAALEDFREESDGK